MEEHIAFHALSRATDGEYSKLRKFREAHATWAAAWEAMRNSALLPKENPRAAWENLLAKKITLLLPGDPGFPALLSEISCPPLGLYWKGTLPTTSQNTLAIVGTRKATQGGKLLAETFARELASTLIIVSGLALGIDAAAHLGCVKSKGRTIAVLAGGVDTPHPRTNERLADRILEEGGALISEHPPGSIPVARRFLERNRLISGLSRGTLIIEAPERSGSLATARFALEQNREVFVVPGPVNHPNFKGSLALLREGARLVRASADILEDLGIEAKSPSPALFSASLNPAEMAIIETLRASASPLSAEILIGKTALAPSLVNQTLSFLLVKKMVQETGDGYNIMSS